MRIDSAAPSPAFAQSPRGAGDRGAGSREGAKGMLDGEGRWEASDRALRGERRGEVEVQMEVGDDVYGEQRRRGWKAE